jgi:polyisoprenoid-binding protein YceI
MTNTPDVAAAVPDYRAGTWTVDLAHSEITFSVRQLFTAVHGRITGFDLTIVTGDDLLDSSVSATIELASVSTGNRRRDEHIRSATFLNVANYPRVTYDSAGIRRAGEGWIIDGDLTLHGVTRAVPLRVAAAGFAADLDGGRHASFSASALVDRRDFGIDRWSGGGAVGTKVAIALAIRAVLVP